MKIKKIKFKNKEFPRQVERKQDTGFPRKTLEQKIKTKDCKMGMRKEEKVVGL